jgi:hypothetical protein
MHWKSGGRLWTRGRSIWKELEGLEAQGPRTTGMVKCAGFAPYPYPGPTFPGVYDRVVGGRFSREQDHDP